MEDALPASDTQEEKMSPREKLIMQLAFGTFALFVMVFYQGGISSALGLTVATYFFWGKLKCLTQGWRMIALPVFVFVTVTVTAPTMWYTFLGNYLDPQLRLAWSEFECEGTNEVYCNTNALYARDKVLEERHVTKTITWWASTARIGDSDEYEMSYTSSGIVFTSWF
jgi:hypothetical protein